VQRYFYAWRDDGLFVRINTILVERARELAGREASPTAGIIDRCRNGRAAPGGEVEGLSPMMRVRARSASSGLAPSKGERHGALCRD
jgi:transposase